MNTVSFDFKQSKITRSKYSGKSTVFEGHCTISMMTPLTESPYLSQSKHGVHKQKVHEEDYLIRSVKNQLNRVHGFLNLSMDWNGYGAARPKTDSIVGAINLLLQLSRSGLRPYFSVPLASGKILVEFTFQGDTYIRIVVADKETCEQIEIRNSSKESIFVGVQRLRFSDCSAFILQHLRAGDDKLSHTT